MQNIIIRWSDLRMVDFVEETVNDIVSMLTNDELVKIYYTVTSRQTRLKWEKKEMRDIRKYLAKIFLLRLKIYRLTGLKIQVRPRFRDMYKDGWKYCSECDLAYKIDDRICPIHRVPLRWTLNK